MVLTHTRGRGQTRGIPASPHRSDVRGTIALTAAAADVEFPAVGLTESQAAGDVLVRDRLLVLFASSVGGRAEVIEAPAPGPEPGSSAVLVCRSTVGGELRVARSHDIAAIDGHPYSDNPFLSPCPEQAPTPARTIFGSVKLVENFHSITVGDVTVTGHLRCYNNVGLRRVDSSAATVLGTRYGQCGTA